MSVDLQIGGPRMDELAVRFERSFEAGERLKVQALVDAPDITLVEMYGVLLRGSVASLTGAIQATALALDLPIDRVRAFAFAGVDHNLENMPPALVGKPAGEA